MPAAETMEMLTSGEYSLTTKRHAVHERKSIIFVKFTDSAQRALSNYLRNANACDVPTIEFDGDEGRLSIPSRPPKGNAVAADADQSKAQFKFDVISNDAMQGKQGRFECVQHRRASKQLIKCGQLTQRLRIHANEDVYETTKNRMAAIEQQQRKNYTVQLDWTSTTTRSSSLNRKMKLTSSKGSPCGALQRGNGGGGGDDLAAAVASAKQAAKLETSNMVRSKSRPVNNAPPKKINAAACLVRKPLRERVVHLLALRPHKRPELEAALKRDGLRDGDRAHIMDTLMAVSNYRDNQYHLSKHAWNDVQEDWLFYTEHERQQIKRNKQLNLTSPSGSSDSGVSVGSNQSPNNNASGGGTTAAASDQTPPHSNKRPGYFNGVDGFQTKRQRISHFVKQESAAAAANAASAYANPSPAGGVAGRIAAAVAATTNDEPPPPPPHTSLHQHHHNNKTVSVKQESKPTPTTHHYNAVPQQQQQQHQLPPHHHHHPTPSQQPPPPPQLKGERTQQPSVGPPPPPPSSSSTAAPPATSTTPAAATSGVTVASPDPVDVGATSPLPPSSRATLEPTTPSYDMPKYMKEYVTITNTEQRSRYKADFMSIFGEYERVHKEVDEVRNLFAQMGESLKEHKKGSRGYERVENEIFKNYYALKSNRKFQDAKRRYEYLHEKLSHIKNIVNEYDDKVRKQMM